MGKYLKSIAKATVLMCAVGALLAVAAPAVAGIVGISLADVGIMANPSWTGAFFGAFGGISAAITPVIERIFGDDKQAETVKTEEKTQVKFDLSPDLSQSPAKTATHCSYIETERAASAQPQRIL